MDVKSIMEEFQLEISDIRWYLAVQVADKILSYKDNREDIAHYIWSGQLENEIYNMEEGFLEELTRDLGKNITDETKIRELLEQVDDAKSQRTF